MSIVQMIYRLAFNPDIKRENKEKNNMKVLKPKSKFYKRKKGNIPNDLSQFLSENRKSGKMESTAISFR